MALPQGIDFRNTNGFANDPPNCYFINAIRTYPRTTPQGNVVGWESGSATTVNDSTSVDPRLAGFNINAGAATSVFRIDLAIAGGYSVGLAVGSVNGGWFSKIELFDGAVSLGVLSNRPTSQSAGSFDDATGTQYSSAAWPASNTKVNKAFSTTILRVNVGTSTLTGNINHLWVEPATPSITQPVQQTVTPGATATFSSIAVSRMGGTITYQWQCCPIGGSFSNIDGATSSAYTTGAQTTANIGDAYLCIVTDSLAGSFNSAVAKLFLTAQLSQGSGNSAAFDGWFIQAKGADLRPSGSYALVRDYFYASGERNQKTIGGTKAAFADYALLSGLISGTIAATETADTGAATGTVAISGIVSTNESADSCAGSGLLGAYGTIAAAQAPDSASAVGAVQVSGSGAAAEAADSIAAAGALQIAATIGSTEAPDIVALAGAVGIGGQLFATEAPDAAASAGTVAVAGPISAIEAADICAAAAMAGAYGTVAATEASDAGAAAGAVALSGIVAGTEAAESVAATGAVQIAGVIASTEVSDAAALAAAVAVSGQISATESADACAASASVIGALAGTIAATESVETANAAGAVDVAGSVGAQEAPDASIGVGSVAIVGSAPLSEAADTAVAAGAVQASGFAQLLEAGDIIVARGEVAIAGSITATEAPEAIFVSATFGAGGIFGWTEAPDTILAAAMVWSTDAGRTRRLDPETPRLSLPAAGAPFAFSREAASFVLPAEISKCTPLAERTTAAKQ